MRSASANTARRSLRHCPIGRTNADTPDYLVPDWPGATIDTEPIAAQIRAAPVTDDRPPEPRPSTAHRRPALRRLFESRDDVRALLGIANADDRLRRAGQEFARRRQEFVEVGFGPGAAGLSQRRGIAIPIRPRLLGADDCVQRRRHPQRPTLLDAVADDAGLERAVGADRHRLEPVRTSCGDLRAAVRAEQPDGPDEARNDHDSHDVGNDALHGVRPECGRTDGPMPTAGTLPLNPDARRRR